MRTLRIKLSEPAKKYVLFSTILHPLVLANESIDEQNWDFEKNGSMLWPQVGPRPIFKFSNWTLLCAIYVSVKQTLSISADPPSFSSHKTERSRVPCFSALYHTDRRKNTNKSNELHEKYSRVIVKRFSVMMIMSPFIILALDHVTTTVTTKIAEINEQGVN